MLIVLTLEGQRSSDYYMKRTRIMGLCLVAVCAIFALTASSALAFENLPHYGQCNTTEAGSTGVKYSNTGCTKVSASGTDFWHPLTTTIAFSSKKEKETGNAVLESAAGVEISCTGEESKTGEYGPGDQVKNTIGEFSGCKALGAGCSSEGQPAEHIHTKKLHGEPGIVKKEAKEEKNIDGNDLRGEESEFLAEFACGPASVLVKGGVVVKAQADSTGGVNGELTNKMSNKIEVEFVTEKPGEQVPSEWTPNGNGTSNKEHKLIEENLESSTNGGSSYEESGQALTVEQFTTGTKPKVELRQCEKTIECKN
jgi:hypothetical protein